MALEKIKELEEKERMHGQTERSKARKAELQVRAPLLYKGLMKKQKREQEEQERLRLIEADRQKK
eukprot:82262-Rhodomonas_salina.1